MDVTKKVNLDDFDGLQFQVWSSTPAVLWTAERPQERGIHVHVYENKQYVIDDTFGTVIYHGQPLQRSELFDQMVRSTIS